MVLLLAGFGLVGCSDDDAATIPTGPDVTTFSVAIENVATAYDLAASGSFSTPVGAGAPGPIGPGGAYEATSDSGTQAVPLAPGVWVVHSDDGALFVPGQPDYGEGLGALAEDGAHSELAAFLADISGVTHLLAPGAWAVHTTEDPIFSVYMADRGDGLEGLAEDGDPSVLSASLASQSGVMESGIFNTPTGAEGPGPLLPGNTYGFSFTATLDERLSFATMLVQTNDLFYAPTGSGIELFDGQTAISGDITNMLILWDAGTEMNEMPGVGLNQAPRQSGADTGDDESGLVVPVNDGYMYSTPGSVLRVTITPE